MLSGEMSFSLAGRSAPAGNSTLSLAFGTPLPQFAQLPLLLQRLLSPLPVHWHVAAYADSESANADRLQITNVTRTNATHRRGA